MGRIPKKLLLVAVIIIILLLIYQPFRASSDEEILFDRIWIDRLAMKPRSYTKLMILFDDGIGITGRLSRYRRSMDLIEFDHRGPFLVRILQDDVQETWKVKTWRCAEGEAPDPDLVFCMTVERNGEVTKYFSWEEDEDDALVRLKRMGIDPAVFPGR